MKLLTSFLSNYYRLKYFLSSSKDREKHLLRSTNLYMKARNRTLTIRKGERFINETDLRRTPLLITQKCISKEKPTPPTLDIFRENIALFLTYPEN